MGRHDHRLLRERNVWLATVRADGRPHLAPVWFVTVDERFWIGTGAASVKARNIAANPSVSVSLEGGDDPLVAEGRATAVPRPFPEPVTAAFLDKYGWDLAVEVDDDIGEVALLRIDVTRWLMGGP
ncbi:MAG: pyridoxamine 5'-phosphate oxidase family protein [Acidimicrobiales bacterium]|nr:pyridoxamine 5'-phosphate oxidase family protein [Acidimicrobiales bacterium]